jgi:hypothetical protein
VLASADGYLALLAGYTPEHSALTPGDLNNTDLSVCGVISYYGFPDMLAEYQYTNQQRLLSEDLPPVSVGPALVKQSLRIMLVLGTSSMTDNVDVEMRTFPQLSQRLTGAPA